LAIWAIHKAETAGSVALNAPSTLSADWNADLLYQGKAFKPAFENPTAELNAVYSSQGRNVGLYLGYYRQQDYGRKLVSSNNVLVTTKDANWAQVGSAMKSIAIDGGLTHFRTAELRGAAPVVSAGDGRLVVAQIYWINGTLTASDYLAKVYSALYRLAGRGDDSAVIIVYTAKDQPAGGQALLESFLVTNYPSINELLLKARLSR
jgi:EpsI family protein